MREHDVVPVVLPEETSCLVLDRLILPAWTSGAVPQERPVVVFVSGPPGAGKTEVGDVVQAALARRGRAVRVGRDLYKREHPRYAQFLTEDVRTAGVRVRPDTARWQAGVEERVRACGWDAVVETALADPNEFRATAAAYRASGHRIEVAAVATQEALTQLGLVARFLDEGRYVSWENHDACSKALARTLAVVEAEGLADRVVVVRRGMDVLYDNEFAGGVWRRQPAAGQAVTREMRRWWSARETAWFRRSSPARTGCNTGRFATAAVGTAVGAIVELAGRGGVAEVLVDETRPLLQGARLTAWELGEAGVPYRLCVDSAAAAAMARSMVDCVLVGANRIAANGDTANKIGTYGLAVAAARHGIPFIVVAPESTWDDDLADGSGIVVEDRDPAEVTGFRGTAIAPAGAAVFNPAFDVTPAELITALVSERRTVHPGGASTGASRKTPQATPSAPATQAGPTAPAELTAPTGEGEPLAIAALLTEFPDHPVPGVVFRDLAGLYAEPGMMAQLAARVEQRFRGQFDRILAVESRGFVLGGALATLTGLPLTLARKPGKLPGAVHEAGYTLEYGSDRLEVQKDALSAGEQVLCVDDVLATGGTLRAVARLVDLCGAHVAGVAVLVALDGMGGRQRLSGHEVLALCEVPA